MTSGVCAFPAKRVICYKWLYFLPGIKGRSFSMRLQYIFLGTMLLYSVWPDILISSPPQFFCGRAAYLFFPMTKTENWKCMIYMARRAEILGLFIVNLIQIRLKKEIRTDVAPPIKTNLPESVGPPFWGLSSNQKEGIFSGVHFI